MYVQSVKRCWNVWVSLNLKWNCHEMSSVITRESVFSFSFFNEECCWETKTTKPINVFDPVDRSMDWANQHLCRWQHHQCSYHKERTPFFCHAFGERLLVNSCRLKPGSPLPHKEQLLNKELNNKTSSFAAVPHNILILFSFIIGPHYDDLISEVGNCEAAHFVFLFLQQCVFACVRVCVRLCSCLYLQA